jgi:hypothetical protein
MKRSIVRNLCAGSMLIALVGVHLPQASASLTPDAPGGNLPIVEGIAPTTEQFETGQLKMSDVSNLGMELFIQDMNRRKDYDYSCHNNQPGPDAEYLWNWVQKGVAEPKTRGYTTDDAGNLVRPDGSAVAMR